MDSVVPYPFGLECHSRYDVASWDKDYLMISSISVLNSHHCLSVVFNRVLSPSTGTEKVGMAGGWDSFLRPTP